MSASAPLASSSSTATTAASAASTPSIAYDLRDASNGYASVASALVRMDATLPIDQLREAVFAAARALLPERYSYLALDVYPPGSSDVDLSKEGADPEDPISSLLPAAAEQDRKRRRIIIVARPLPATAGVHGEQRLALQHIANVQAASATVSPALLMIVLLLLCRALLCCVRRQRAPHPLSQPSGRGGTRMRSIAPRSRRWTRSWSSSAIDSA